MIYQAKKAKKTTIIASAALLVLFALILMKLVINPRGNQFHPAPKRVEDNNKAAILTQSKRTNTRKISVKQGDNLFAIFANNQLPPKTVYKLLKLPLGAKYLSNIHPGDVIYLKQKGQQLIGLNYPIADNQELEIIYKNKQFYENIIDIPTDKRQVFFNATINHSLSRDLGHAGVSQQMILDLLNIFSNNFNFHRSLKKGDRIQLIIEETQSKHQIHAKQTGLIAARLQHGHKNITALRFEAPNGEQKYYTPQGLSLKPPFLRYPLKYNYISSPFSLHRKHPILGITRPHYGVDFAAPIGRAIHAAADGKIYLIGKDRGYGNTIKIKHTQHYTTVYAHMSRFNPILKRGSWVKKGQIIGYVGSTGLSTGPHLHYEVRIDGIAHDPLKVKLPDAQPIPSRYRQQFLIIAKQLQLALNNKTSTHWASTNQRQHTI